MAGELVGYVLVAPQRALEAIALLVEPGGVQVVLRQAGARLDPQREERERLLGATERSDQQLGSPHLHVVCSTTAPPLLLAPSRDRASS